MYGIFQIDFKFENTYNLRVAHFLTQNTFGKDENEAIKNIILINNICRMLRYFLFPSVPLIMIAITLMCKVR